MAPVSMVFGVLLIAVGLLGYFGTDTTSPTALIPAGIGLLLLLLGLLALKEGLRKHAMHVAAMVGLLGTVGALVRPVRTLAAGEEIKNPAALTSQLVTAALCALFLGLCVHSFIQARRRRAAAAPPGA
jgi:uncharacterized membrane protein